MRTLRLLALLCAVLVAGVAPVAAQTSFGIPNQGILQYTTASVTVVNSSASSALWSSVVPGAYTATAPNTNSVYSPSFVVTPVPLHLQMFGQFTTNIGAGAVGNINMGVNYGGGSTGVASVALVNAVALGNNLNSAPWQLDVWMAPVATATLSSLPAAGACTFYLNARLTLATASGGNAPQTFDAHTCSNSSGAFLASAQQLNVLMNWASASATNSWTVYRGTLMLGN